MQNSGVSVSQNRQCWTDLRNVIPLKQGGCFQICPILDKISYLETFSRTLVWLNINEIWNSVYIYICSHILAYSISSLNKVLILQYRKHKLQYRKHKIKRTWQYTHPQERVRGHFAQTLIYLNLVFYLLCRIRLRSLQG